MSLGFSDRLAVTLVLQHHTTFSYCDFDLLYAHENLV